MFFLLDINVVSFFTPGIINVSFFINVSVVFNCGYLSIKCCNLFSGVHDEKRIIKTAVIQKSNNAHKMQIKGFINFIFLSFTTWTIHDYTEVIFYLLDLTF